MWQPLHDRSSCWVEDKEDTTSSVEVEVDTSSNVDVEEVTSPVGTYVEKEKTSSRVDVEK